MRARRPSSPTRLVRVRDRVTESVRVRVRDRVTESARDRVRDRRKVGFLSGAPPPRSPSATVAMPWYA